ncbi:MAG: hypothetical protein IPP94_14955 [Ignavibacteria bacterium]|nr:hypothetical protein [Ignavibacteria bacterium]
MEPATLKECIDLHREEIIRVWSELWNYIQRRRPESHFPDPPYASILAQMPHDPSYSPPLSEDIVAWFEDSPVFCTGAAFCQMHVSIASILVREQYPQRAGILSELETSLEALILDSGTRKWIANVLQDTGKQEVAQSERLAVIGQLAAGVAHEIGNPLTSISSIVQLLERRSEDPFVSGQLKEVKRSIDRIARIVRELVDFSRPAPSVPSMVQVNDILATAIRLMHYDHRAQKVEFTAEHNPDLPIVHIVADQLLQVLLNLLINAVDAMDGVGAVATRTGCDSRGVVITITDSGHGIPASIIARIFDPFFTTKPMGKGTGLGLSVSYGIMKRYGGHIDVDSEVGVGSTFTIVLPLAPPPPAATVSGVKS